MNGSSAWISNQQPSARGVSEWVSEWMINVSRFNANHIKRTNSHFYLFICRNEASIFQVSKCFLRRAARNVIVLDQVLYDRRHNSFSLAAPSSHTTPHHIIQITPHLQRARVRTLLRFLRLFTICACTDVVATRWKRDQIFSRFDDEAMANECTRALKIHENWWRKTSESSVFYIFRVDNCLNTNRNNQPIGLSELSEQRENVRCVCVPSTINQGEIIVVSTSTSTCSRRSSVYFSFDFLSIQPPFKPLVQRTLLRSPIYTSGVSP